MLHIILTAKNIFVSLSESKQSNRTNERRLIVVSIARVCIAKDSIVSDIPLQTDVSGEATLF